MITLVNQQKGIFLLRYFPKAVVIVVVGEERRLHNLYLETPSAIFRAIYFYLARNRRASWNARRRRSSGNGGRIVRRLNLLGLLFYLYQLLK